MTLLTRLTTCLLATAAMGAQASTLTETSPTNGPLPSTITSVGGIVIDLTGLNGNRLLTQAAASASFIGFPDASDYPLLVGSQAGFTPAIIAALGGGISAAAVRLSLYDGDSQSGNFDFHQDTLTLNGVDVGDFSDVATNQTSSLGAFVSASTGFGDDTFDTGWFKSTDATVLSSIYASLSTGKVDFRVTDLSPGDQYFDFTQGVDSSIVDVGSPPVITPPVNAVPEPETFALLLAGLASMALAAARGKRRHAAESLPRAMAV